MVTRRIFVFLKKQVADEGNVKCLRFIDDAKNRKGIGKRW